MRRTTYFINIFFMSSTFLYHGGDHIVSDFTVSLEVFVFPTKLQAP